MCSPLLPGLEDTYGHMHTHTHTHTHTTLAFSHAQALPHHHEVELAVCGTDGFKDEGDPPELVARAAGD